MSQLASDRSGHSPALCGNNRTGDEKLKFSFGPLPGDGKAGTRFTAETDNRHSGAGVNGQQR